MRRAVYVCMYTEYAACVVVSAMLLFRLHPPCSCLLVLVLVCVES